MSKKIYILVFVAVFLGCNITLKNIKQRGSDINLCKIEYNTGACEVDVLDTNYHLELYKTTKDSVLIIIDSFFCRCSSYKDSEDIIFSNIDSFLQEN